MSDRDDVSKAWKLPPSAYMASRPAEFAIPLQPFSNYVAMRDGVRIAVDVYLPQGAPEVPMLIESGVNIEAIIWLGLGGPAKLPPEVVAKLFDAMKQVAADADAQKRIADMGAETAVSKPPQEFREFMLRERDRWGKVISDAKIAAQ